MISFLSWVVLSISSGKWIHVSALGPCDVTAVFACSRVTFVRKLQCRSNICAGYAFVLKSDSLYLLKHHSYFLMWGKNRSPSVSMETSELLWLSMFRIAFLLKRTFYYVLAKSSQISCFCIPCIVLWAQGLISVKVSYYVIKVDLFLSWLDMSSDNSPFLN